jgi:uncharacterized protein (TIGR02646 family)
MIRVLRPAAPPAVLAIEGNARHQEYCAAYSAGTREFEFDPAIYGHDSVKQTLVAMHHGKCCYCESYVRHISPGTIDHYRPKAASQQRTGDPLIRPGYYWLAYDWENLLFLCQTCNQTYKRNLFPLLDETQRALTHLHSLDVEEPLLIDPSKDDPADFISFRDEIAFALGDNLLGRTTIEILGLNKRNDLLERRREKIGILRALHRVVDLVPQSPEAADAAQFLNEAVANDAEYAAMSRALLR